MNEVFEMANNEIDKNGVLNLPIRKKIWKSFGSIVEVGMVKEITEGVRKRVVLAEACVKKMLYLWDEVTNYDSRPSELLKMVNDFMNGICSREVLEDKMKLFINQLEVEAYESKYEKVSLIGFATVYVANIALYDELLFTNSDDDDLDDDLDSFTWDTSYLISLVYSDNMDEDMRKGHQKEFWEWYLNEAKKLEMNN
jgi:hypothetical protein